MNRYLYAFLLLECINFFGFNCQRKIDELYRGYYGSIIQCIFGIGAMLATICSYAFTSCAFDWRQEEIADKRHRKGS